MQQVGGFSPGTPDSTTNKSDRHHITEILLKVPLNTINHKPNYNIIATLLSKQDVTIYIKCFVLKKVQFINIQELQEF